MADYAPIRGSFAPDPHGIQHYSDDSAPKSYRFDTRPPGMYNLLHEVVSIAQRLTIDERVTRAKELRSPEQ